MIREISKNLLNRKCNGDIKKAVEAGYYTDWTTERIKGAFNFGNGTEKDLKRYMRDNSKYCVFLEVSNV